MPLSRALDAHRVLLGAALVVKGVSWPHAPTPVALVLVVAGLVAIHGRWARPAFAAAAVLVWLVFASGSYRANHFALMAVLTTFAAAIAPSDRSRRPIDELAVLLTMVQVATVYLYAAVWKVDPEFLSGAVLRYEWGRSWLAGPGGAPEWLAVGAAVATITGEVAVAGLLWARRTVRWGIGLGVVLHVGMILSIGAAPHTTGELICFALLCGSSYPLFLARSEPASLGAGGGRSAAVAGKAPWTLA